MTDTLIPMIQAVAATTTQATRLGKGETNDHGGYNYVSIDRYYETVAKTAAANGLVWILREISMVRLSDLGKSGALHLTYDVDLFHSGGYAMPGFSRLSILHPIQGAQTIGSAMSYADKMFMRQTFKVPTGEGDADETDNKSLEIMSRPAEPLVLIPQYERIPITDPVPVLPVRETPARTVDIPAEADWPTVVAIFKTWVVDCKTEEELKEFWQDNLEMINKLKADNAEAYKEVTASFTSRKLEIKGG